MSGENIDALLGRSIRAHANLSIVTLDFMRAAAALIVFLGHNRYLSFVEFSLLPIEDQGTLTKILFALARLGQEAVLVFFVLSGYLVGGQIIRHACEDRFSLTLYAIERSTRIFLPLVPACLLTVSVNWFIFGGEPRWFQVFLNMIGLNGIVVDTLSNNPPLWTLAYEIWFYILAGTIGYLFSERRSSPLPFLILTCSVCVFSILSARYLLFWCSGALSVLLLDNPHRRILALIGGALVVTGIATHQLASGSKTFIPVVYLSQPTSEALLCMGVSLVIPFLCNERLNARLAFLRRPITYFSALSYTLYLVHYPILLALGVVFPIYGNLSWKAIGMFCVKTALVWAIVTVFYFLFEANTAALRRYVKNLLLAKRKLALPG